VNVNVNVNENEGEDDENVNVNPTVYGFLNLIVGRNAVGKSKYAEKKEIVDKK
jgi:hypothetical protein